MNMQTTVSVQDYLEPVTAIEGDYYALSSIASEILAHEKYLFTCKWFDYRFMTPFEATMTYVDAFAAVSRRIYKRELDRGRADHIRIPSSMHYQRLFVANAMTQKDKARFTGYWRARQVADALCMPYDLFIDEAITARMRRWQRTYLPHPQQLYSEFVVEKVQARWEEMQRARNHFPEHHAFMVQNYRGAPAQNDVHEYLFGQAESGGNRIKQICTFVQRDLLPLEKVKARLTPSDFERVCEDL